MISIGEFDKIAKMPADTEGVVSVLGDAKTALELSPVNDRFVQISQERRENNIYVRSQLLTALRNALADRLNDQTDVIAQDFFKKAERKLFGRLDKDGRYGVKVAISDLRARDVRQLINGLNEVKTASDSLIPKEPDHPLAKPQDSSTHGTCEPASTSLFGRFRSALAGLPTALEKEFPRYKALSEDIRNGFAHELGLIGHDLEMQRMNRPEDQLELFNNPYDQQTLKQNEPLRREALFLCRETGAQVVRMIGGLLDDIVEANGGTREEWKHVGEAICNFIIGKVEEALEVNRADKPRVSKKNSAEASQKKMRTKRNLLEEKCSKFSEDLRTVMNRIEAKDEVDVECRRALYGRLCDLRKDLAKEVACAGDPDAARELAEFKKRWLKDLPTKGKLRETLGLTPEDVSFAEVVEVESFKRTLRWGRSAQRPLRAVEMRDSTFVDVRPEKVVKFNSIWQNHDLSKDEIIGDET